MIYWNISLARRWTFWDMIWWLQMVFHVDDRSHSFRTSQLRSWLCFFAHKCVHLRDFCYKCSIGGVFSERTWMRLSLPRWLSMLLNVCYRLLVFLLSPFCINIEFSVLIYVYFFTDFYGTYVNVVLVCRTFTGTDDALWYPRSSGVVDSW